MATHQSTSRIPSDPRAGNPQVVPADEYTHFTACDACRKRKKKCDGRIAGCQHCATKGLTCVYTPKRSKPPAARRPTSEVLSHRTEDLDERLRRIEDAVFRNLELGGQAKATLSRHRREASSDDSDHIAEEELWDPRVLPPVNPVAPAPTPVTPRPEPVALAQPQSPRFEGVLKITAPGAPVGSCVFVGASSPFSFVSRTGVRWIDAKLGNNSFSKLLQRAEEKYLALDAEGVFGSGLSGEAAVEFVETPELRELYINEYFTHINPHTPLFSQRFFHSPSPTSPTNLRDSRLWSATTSIALALGAQHLSRLAPPCSQHRAAAQHYFTRTSQSLPSFLFSTPIASLAAVQAIVGMALYLWEADDLQALFTLLGLAVSLATQAGLHRDPQKLRIDCDEAKSERCNVWWVLFCMEKEQSLRTGRMSGIAEHDVDVPAPPTTTPFGRRVQLAWLMSRVMRLLYSTTPAPPQLVAALHQELETWREQSPEVNNPLEVAVQGLHTWEQHATLMRARWHYFCALMSVGQLGVGAGGLERWARSEAVAVMQGLANGSIVRNRGGLLMLVGGAWVLFFARACRSRKADVNGCWENSACVAAAAELSEIEDADRDGDLALLRCVAECLERNLWPPGEGARVRVLFLELVKGMAELVRDGL